MARLSIPCFVVNAFAEKPFAGNPAGICVLDRWLPAAAMQAIAAENGLPVTAFLVGVGGSYAMRWFTSVVEEEMCGHATLGASWVVLNRLVPGLERVVFATTAGALEVTRSINIYTLDLPAQPPTVCTAPDMLVAALGAPPREVLRAAYYIAVFDNAGEIAALQPDFAAISALDTPGLSRRRRASTSAAISQRATLPPPRAYQKMRRPARRMRRSFPTGAVDSVGRCSRHGSCHHAAAVCAAKIGAR